MRRIHGEVIFVRRGLLGNDVHVLFRLWFRSIDSYPDVSLGRAFFYFGHYCNIDSAAINSFDPMTRIHGKVVFVDHGVLGIIKQVEQEIYLSVPYGFWLRSIDPCPEFFLRQRFVSFEHQLK
jgi:hypothetical protein